MRVGTKPEARRTVRRNVDFDCGLLTDLWDEPVPHRVTDLSETGIWIATDFPLEVGTEVAVELTPPDWDTPLYVSGEVRRVDLSRRMGDPRSAGMGIAFQALRADDRRRLTWSLRRLRPIDAQLAARTLAGVPVGAVQSIERRSTQDRTLSGYAPRSDSYEQQRRRLPERPRLDEPDTERGFGGGLALATWLFDPGHREALGG